MRDLAELNINEGGLPVGRMPPTEKQIHAFETRFGVRLPDDYLTLLRHSNGGHPERNVFCPKGLKGDYLESVDHFYHLNDDQHDVEGLWWTTEQWQRVLSNRVISIADNGGGDQIMLVYDNEIPGIKLCIHDEDFRFVHVADSFAEFIDMLSEDPDAI